MFESAHLKVVVGLGKTGFSCVRFLRSYDCSVAVTDTRDNPPHLEELQKYFPEVPVSLGQLDETFLNHAAELIVSPGVSLHEPAIAKQLKRGIPAIGDIELFAKEVEAPIVAITGSNGKSTVTSLVGHMAAVSEKKVKVGGNLGIPALDLISNDEPDLYVLELSSFQLETTYSLCAASAVNLNVTPDHMDRYENFEEYLSAKLRVYQGCRIPVINLDDPASFRNVDTTGNVVAFSLQEPVKNDFGLRRTSKGLFLARGKKNLLPTSQLQIKGQHQMANALAALALGTAVQLPLEGMLTALPTFPGLAHRCQWVTQYEGVDWYNDSKATNVGSACAAIVGLGSDIKGKLILIAGGLGKNADFSPLCEPVAKYVRAVILLGKDRDQLSAVLKGVVPLSCVSSMEEAVCLAKDLALPDDAVILSPACASFDMFKGFDHRGDVFMAIVRRLIE